MADNEKVLLGGQIIAVDSETKELAVKARLDSDGGTVHAALFNTSEQKINPATDDALKQVGSGAKTVTDVSDGAEALTATATACKYVLISAPVTQATGAATNTKICLIGDADAQKIKLHHTDIDGVKVECEDAADVYVLPGDDGEGVDWVAFG